MKIPVYRDGKWISFSVSDDMKRYWSQANMFQAASVYATAITKGYSPSQSEVYAEAWVNKQLYEGLSYDTKLEAVLKSFLV